MSDYAASVQAVGMRVTTLDASGSLVTGDTSSYVTKAFTRFNWTPEYEEGEEISTTAADGSQCVYFKMPDTLKEIQVEFEICKPQPEIYEKLGNGSLLVGGTAPAYNVTNKALASNVATLTVGTHTFQVGDQVFVSGVDATFDGLHTVTAVAATTFSYAKTAANVTSSAATGTAATGGNVGWAAPELGTSPNLNGVGIEVWSRAVVGGRLATFNPYWRWVLPLVRTRLEGERTLENGALASVFSGVGQGNAAFGSGPDDDWLWPTNSALLYARDDHAVTAEGYYPIS